MSRTSRRKTHLVDPETQISLLKRITLHWLSFVVSTCMALLMWLMLFEQEPGQSWSDLFALFLQRYAPFLIISAAMLPVFLRDTLKLSNKFAGPIQRLRRAMSNLAEGSHVDPISFRKGDFLQGLATDFNQVLSRCQGIPEREAEPGSTETRDASQHELISQ